jgi:hypothetical protein
MKKLHFKENPLSEQTTLQKVIFFLSKNSGTTGYFILYSHAFSKKMAVYLAYI